MGKLLPLVLGAAALAGLWYYVQFVLWRGVRVEAWAVWIWGRLYRRAQERRARASLSPEAGRPAIPAGQPAPAAPDTRPDEQRGEGSPSR